MPVYRMLRATYCIAQFAPRADYFSALLELTLRQTRLIVV